MLHKTDVAEHAYQRTTLSKLQSCKTTKAVGQHWQWTLTARHQLYLWQDALQDLADRHDLADGSDGHHILEVPAAVLKCRVYIATKQG